MTIAPNLDMKEMLAQAGASQKEIQAYYDQHPIKVRYDNSGARNPMPPGITPGNNSSSSSGMMPDITRQALKEGTKQ